ncbi:histone PARylation factor 1 [Lingula anatina]|uniref:Histone PARylation factor 1 n=1 Tax=Lingula anatina TaxID=7574 RepID=A0A2R2MTZ9_LINAN|nr:histone PARylation factor 1 [Lingula anatina]|eukprot:XP_023933517.1 histone PARylation factor 1 [Lingula anatina]
MADKGKRSSEQAEKRDRKPLCTYGKKCYRKNPRHLKEFSHPWNDASEGVESPAKRRRKESVSPEKTDQNTTAAGSPDDSEKESQVQLEFECPGDVKEFIKEKFLMEMPDDFYEFWEFCKTLNPECPSDALVECLGLQLVGPYDVLAGQCVKVNSSGAPPCYLRHWRYFYDPPEFLTVIKGDDTLQFHIGYYRDDPKELPCFVATNAAAENGIIKPMGENVFACVKLLIDEKIKKDKSSKAKLTDLQSKLISWSEKKSYSLEAQTKAMKARAKKVVCKTFHGAGIVVPVDANEVGYREMPESPADLKKMFKKIENSKTEEERNVNIDPLQELITLVQFANDECDYGEGLELGLDLFTYGGGDTFKGFILALLPMAYQFLQRPEFAQIIQAHLEDRKHSAKLSQMQ